MARKKQSQYQIFEENAPECPGYTCSDIDDVIASMENLREMNTQLRDSVEYWKAACEQSQEEVDELESWKQHIKLYVKEH